MGLFRTILVLLLVAFAAASFGFGLELKRRLVEKDGQLWESRRENRRLASTLGDRGDENLHLERSLAALRQVVEERDRRLAELESALRDLDLDLAIAVVDREDLAQENASLAQRVRLLERQVDALGAEVVRVHLVETGKDWIAGLHELGARLGRSNEGRVEQIRPTAPLEVTPESIPVLPSDGGWRAAAQLLGGLFRNGEPRVSELAGLWRSAQTLTWFLARVTPL